MELHPALRADEQQIEHGRAVEDLLAGLLSEQRTMMDLARAHREAIASADPASIRVIVEQEAAALQRVGGLEAKRRELVALLSPEDPRITVTGMAEKLAQPWRDRTVELAKQLRELALRVQREQRTVRLASESLLSHMEGMMQQLARKLSHAGTYTNTGSVDVGRQQVVSGVDLTH